MRITEAEQENRKKRMLHVAYKLFCEYGIDAVAVSQVAKAAGVSPNSIYRYFDSKVQLVHSAQTLLWDEIVSCTIASTGEKSFHANSGMEELSFLLDGFKDLYNKHSQYILFAYDSKAFFIRNNIKLDEEWYKAMLEPIRRVFVKTLKKGQQDGSILRTESPDTQFLMLWCLMRSYTDTAVLYDKVYTGENPWTTQFDRVIYHIQNVLRPEQ